MLRLLWNPHSLIHDLREKPSFGLALFTLVISSLLLAGSLVLLSIIMPDKSSLLLQSAVTTFVGTILLLLYTAALLTSIMKTLSGRGSYTAGLSSLSLPLFPFSVATSLVVAANVILNTAPQDATVLVGALVWTILALLTPFLLALTVSTFFSALKELFETNMITALLGKLLLLTTLLLMGALATAKFWLPLIKL